ncbi:isoleucine--tRNA ligase [Candidatus Falkowbacteria bacterium]|nr:isoleucine--tRNA ligase [Candidatus Falkowbacteria bacterium]
MEKSPIASREETILQFWRDNNIFQKSVTKDSPKGDYVFYDGPPFATGLPHYGHILGSVIKDVVPRYMTMKGYRVPRRWGWDCHGLPIENLIEKKLAISGKKEIETKIGVEKFNEKCRADVLMYVSEWKKMVERIGRWIEFDNSYKTMDSTYMESVWWALKTLWDRDLIYQGRRVLMYCPRCETPISKAEVAMDNSYKDITEESLTTKFKIKDPGKHNLPDNTFILAWTTTPWTLPANVALAVGADIEYALVKQNDEYYILADELVEKVITEKSDRERKIKGSELDGIEYEPLIDVPAFRDTGKRLWYVTTPGKESEFVTTEEGTGVVHTAVVYGETDYNLGLEKDLPVVPLLDDKGMFNADAPELIRGQYFKKAEKVIKDYLTEHNLIFSRKQTTHSYPHCWRCDTQLFYNAISAWFINVQKIKPRLIELNEQISWYPEHLKHGRFLNNLETAPDWNISRNRYWATPLPFWICDNPDCAAKTCIGSLAELKDQATNYNQVYSSDTIGAVDLHKHKADQIKLKCIACGGAMSRIPEVIDCWVESASMPFAEHHYPFENEKVFKHRFPGQYIAEYIAQTRAWFYYMHVMSVALFDNISFANCVTTGTILNDKGEKLSKSKQNYTDPWDIINTYGVDALRYYLMTSVVMQADNLFFNDREVRDVYNKVINILSNVVTFYQTFSADIAVPDLAAKDLTNVLDIWICSKLETLKQAVTSQMDNYNMVKAGRPIKDFIDKLSTWYVRRSRDRFKSDDAAEKLRALATLRYVLMNLAKLMAPFTPFIAEEIWQTLGGQPESVHLGDWPDAEPSFLHETVLTEMDMVRKIVEAGLAARAAANIKVRQPLTSYATTLAKTLPAEYTEIIKDELNVSAVTFGEDKLDTELTPELAEQGLYRELVRAVNALRKAAGLTIQDRVTLYYQTDSSAVSAVLTKFAPELQKDTLTKNIKNAKVAIDGDLQTEADINGAKVWLGIKK